MTTETKHTPTPWFIGGTENRGETYFLPIYSRKHPQLIADVFGKIQGGVTEEAKANATFIIDACNNIQKTRELSRGLTTGLQHANVILQVILDRGLLDDESQSELKRIVVETMPINISLIDTCHAEVPHA